VREGSEFPPGSIIAGVPAKQIGERDAARENRLNAWQYHWNAQAYRRGDHRAWTGERYARWLAEISSKVERDEDVAGIR
jgi:carbonic anhydrase/acetyltransferase-like protein (isoleucine patch superfamily)